MGPSLVAVSGWLGGLGATLGICAVAGWTVSTVTTCSERHVFKSKQVTGEYPRLQRFAPCDDEDTQVCLCDGVGLALTGGLAFSLGTLSDLWFTPDLTYFALKRATLQAIGLAAVGQSLPGGVVAFFVVWAMETEFPSMEVAVLVWKAIVAAVSFQAGFDMWDMICGGEE
eukprot:GGOE01046032.1.p1 GENE.GGOE01046032.1~~GGOE01046032.1.p1  ORF type:complete len:181 (+),score=60.57 GGOE01046032.1:34-543(+)